MAFGRVGAYVGALTAGSLLKRTLLSIGAFVLGSAAFVTLASLILVSIVRGVFPSHAAGAKSTSQRDEADSASGTKEGAKVLKPRKTKSATDESNKDE